jgi:D-alanyl-D-alanine carboxypeptidase/D-alanyl-D-alanine-endopeptidase (penicillin-binding protein 4)
MIRIVDGSGLSRHNLTSPAVIVRLLETLYNSQHFNAYYHSLPIAGVDGTIKGRMRHTGAEGILRAKTGTLSAVTALSGYVQTADGEWLAFSMMMMNYPTEARVYRRVQDRIGVFLSQMRRESF